jgi:hypothetical protein
MRMSEGLAVAETGRDAAADVSGRSDLVVYVPASFDQEGRAKLVGMLRERGFTVEAPGGAADEDPWSGFEWAGGDELCRLLGDEGGLRAAADDAIETAVRCNVCVLLAPADPNTYLSVGFAAGFGARWIVVVPEGVLGAQCLMFRAADDLVTTLEAAVEAVLREAETIGAQELVSV